MQKECKRGENMNRKKLFALTAGKGLTQADLADKAGLSRTAIYGVMKGRKPRLPTLGKIAKALGVKPSELLDM